MSGAMTVVMVTMMVVMMGGMLVGGAWAFIRRRRNRSDH
jgi:LPXTG-motif cell wall-anchored protein